MASKQDLRQSQAKTQNFKQIGTATGADLGAIVSGVNTEFNSPLRLSATFPTANAVLNFEPSVVTAADGANKSMSPVQDSVLTVPASTINFQTQATSGATFIITWPASTVGFYRRAGFSLLSTGEISVLFSNEAATLGALDNPGLLFDPNGVSLGYINLQATNVLGYFKTANSATNIIENSGIYRFTTGSGGSGSGSSSAAGDPDTFYLQNAEEATLADFTQTGLEISTDNPLNGTRSFRLIHQAASTRSFKETIDVARRFRDINATMRLTLRSTATSGNLTILFRDETNNAVIGGTTQQIQTDSFSVANLSTTSGNANIASIPQASFLDIEIGASVTGTGIQTGTVVISKNSSTNTITLSKTANATGSATLRFSLPHRKLQFGFNIPAGCSQISYTISALQESGLPETYVDDLVFSDYWVGTANEGQSEIVVPTINSQSSYLEQTVTFTNATITGSQTSQSGSGIYSYNAGTGIYTVLKDGDFQIHASLSNAGAASISTAIVINSILVAVDTTPSTATSWGNSGWSGKLLVGQTFYISNASTNSSDRQRISVMAQAVTETSVIVNDIVPAKAMNGNASIEVPTIKRQNLYAGITSGSSVNLGIGISSGYTDLFLVSSNTLTALKNIKIDASSSVGATSDAANSAVTSILALNGTTISTDVCRSQGVGQSIGASASCSIEMNAGDQLSFNITTGTNTSPTFRFSISAECIETETKVWSATQTLVEEESDTSIRVSGANGFGSTSTLTRRFASISEFTGNDVVYQDSATLGGQFTIQTSGIYSLSYSEVSNANSTGIVTNIVLNGTTSLAISGDTVNTTLASAKRSAAAWTGNLNVGDIITAQVATPANHDGFAVNFTLSKIGRVKTIDTVSDQKMEIPTSELRFEGASTRGAVATGIVKFDSIAKLRGDAFSIVNDANNGTAITILKNGKLDISISLQQAQGVGAVVSINQTDLTTTPNSASERLLTVLGNSTGGAQTNSSAISIFVRVGDVIRVACVANPTASISTNFNLFFQEQEIAVSVSNVLPQFTDKDSCLKLTGANGFGSTATLTRRYSSVVQNIGKDINYVDSPTLGGQFIALTDGIYHVTARETSSSNATESTIIINLNGTQVAANRDSYNTSAAIIRTITTTWSGWMSAGDVITASVSIAANNNGSAADITIAKVGKPNVTGVDVTPFIDIPQPVTQGITISQPQNAMSDITAGGLQYNLATATVINTGSSGVIALVNDTANTRTLITALKRCTITASIRCAMSALGANVGLLKTSGVGFGTSNDSSAAGANVTAAGSTILEAGESAYIGGAALSNTINSCAWVVTAEALSDQILTEPDTFSSDTASFVFAPSSSYTLTTLANAPVGTFITFNYAANTNTRTQNDNAPTQTTASMNTNGIQIFTRAYNAGSTSQNPCAVAIQIGKGMKGVSRNIYKTTGKITAGSTDAVVSNSGTTQSGIAVNAYDETTGILYIDAARAYDAAVTTAAFLFNDVTNQNNGYLVINASKNPALVGITSESVAVRAINSSGQAITTGPTGTVVTWDASKIFDTHNALNAATGIFTAPVTGYYQVNCSLFFQNDTYTVNQACSAEIEKNGVRQATGAGRAMTTTAISLNALVSDVVYLVKGDTLNIRGFNDSGPTALQTGNTTNYLSIAKV